MDTYVAVYGTLRAGYGNHTLLHGAALVGQGRTEREFTMLTSGFPVCLADDDSGLSKAHIVVEVYDIGAYHDPAGMLRRLDSLEGHPDWYCREQVQVNLDDGSSCIAWMYIMPGTRDDFPSWAHVPSGDYAQARTRRYG